MEVCRNCSPGEACVVPPAYQVYHVENYGDCIGEEAMKQEIYQRGPIVASIAVPDLLESYTEGIYCDQTGDLTTVHAVEVVGFGEEEGAPYWLVRNSWGAEWGLQGFFKLCRGVNNLDIETKAAWATPLNTWSPVVWHNSTVAEQTSDLNDKEVYAFPQP